MKLPDWRRSNPLQRVTENRNAASDETSSASLEESARQQRISFLQTYIADCEREIQMLSDTIADWR